MKEGGRVRGREKEEGRVRGREKEGREAEGVRERKWIVRGREERGEEKAKINTDLFSELSSQSDSDDEASARALSRRWYFRKTARKWFRRQSEPSHPHTGSTSGRPYSAPQDCTQCGCTGKRRGTGGGSQRPMLVSDLSCSLSSIPSTVKTYSFTLSEEIPAIPELPCRLEPGSPNPAPSTPMIVVSDITNGNHDSTALKTGAQNGGACSGSDSSTQLNSSGEEPLPESLGIGSMESFTDGIMKAFESNLMQLHHYKSLSLPDVFAEAGNSQLSSCSVSTASIVESSKDDSSFVNDSRRCSTPSINPDPEYRQAILSSEGKELHTPNGCNACSSFADQVDGTSATPSPYVSMSDEEEEGSSSEIAEETSRTHKAGKVGKKRKSHHRCPR